MCVSHFAPTVGSQPTALILTGLIKVKSYLLDVTARLFLIIICQPLVKQAAAKRQSLYI